MENKQLKKQITNLTKSNKANARFSSGGIDFGGGISIKPDSTPKVNKPPKLTPTTPATPLTESEKSEGTEVSGTEVSAGDKTEVGETSQW